MRNVGETVVVRTSIGLMFGLRITAISPDGIYTGICSCHGNLERTTEHQIREAHAFVLGNGLLGTTLTELELSALTEHERQRCLVARDRVRQEREGAGERQRLERLERDEGVKRVRELLKSLIAPEEAERLDKTDVFYFTTPAKTVYRIKATGSISGNISVVKKGVDVNLLDSFGRIETTATNAIDMSFCVHITDGGMIPENNAIAQVLLLSADEGLFLSRANITYGDWDIRPDLKRLRKWAQVPSTLRNYREAGYHILHCGMFKNYLALRDNLAVLDRFCRGRGDMGMIVSYFFPPEVNAVFRRGFIAVNGCTEEQMRQTFQEFADGAPGYPEIDPRVYRRLRDAGVIMPRRRLKETSA